MHNARILIVEDEGIEALDLQNRLIGQGYTAPDIAATGEEAVKKTEETAPDLVLMDIMLHGEIDGVTAAEQIQARFDIPVIYITAFADEDTLQRAKITEPYGYLVKPFRERELYVTIDMALYKHKMEKKLREREKWFATTLRSIGDAVIATDNNGLVTFMNPMAEKLTGWKLEESQNKKLTEIFNIINMYSRKPAENPVTKILVEGLTVDLANHTILIARDGTEIAIDDSAAPIKDDKGNITGVVLAFRDITERKQAEEALRKSYEELDARVRERTAELEKLNQALRVEIEERKQAEEIISRQTQEIIEVSTPVIQIWEGIVSVPLIGTLDSIRAQQLMEQLLEKIVETGSSVALLDVTGVPAIDSKTARHLLETISAVRLLGAEVVLTGIRPAIARTLAQLGVDLSNVNTRSSFSAGLLHALTLLKLRVVNQACAD
ncbi:RsbT co-antagonist protein RsbRA [Pelotomaculum sp. FP]|uniref:PAS domain S-box protein n=1 Tax=Pelotomaculum sp. FP TaxID=261474 RepID=UPI0011053318|nr:PAS domain S-box protein [Pelotomaculum sp. FP]TEB15980.1 RsbT co-antagonist protein RsbRA [Pelotomaculum sp. FP]